MGGILVYACPSTFSFTREPGLTTKAWTFLLIGLVLATALFSVVPFRSQPVSLPSPDPTPPQLRQEQVPLVAGTEPLPQLFIKAGCPVCHMIPGIPGAHGKVGPRLTLKTTGPKRIVDPGYTGEAETVKEYIIESILKPRAYVVEGYPDRTMPTWYSRKLTAQALERIAAYLEVQSGLESDG